MRAMVLEATMIVMDKCAAARRPTNRPRAARQKSQRAQRLPGRRTRPQKVGLLRVTQPVPRALSRVREKKSLSCAQ